MFCFCKDGNDGSAHVCVFQSVLHHINGGVDIAFAGTCPLELCRDRHWDLAVLCRLEPDRVYSINHVDRWPVYGVKFICLLE